MDIALIGDRRGQAAVELALVIPVLMALAAASLHALAFIALCAGFDESARNAVRLEAEACADPDAAVEAIEREVEDDLEGMMPLAREPDVSVTYEREALGPVAYEVTLEYDASLLGLPLGEAFGFSVPSSTHTIRIVAPVHRDAVII